MSQSSPEYPTGNRSAWATIAAAAFLVVSLLAAGLIVAGVDPVAALFPTPTNPPALIRPTDAPPTAVIAVSPTVPAISPARALVTLTPPQDDPSGLAKELPDIIQNALEGSQLAQRLEVRVGPADPDAALQVAWTPGDDGLLRLTIHGRFEPAPVSIGDSLKPYSLVGTETTPLIVDPAGDPSLAGGLAAALLELALRPEPGTVDRIRGLQALPSTLKPDAETNNQAIILFAMAQAQTALGDLTPALDTYSQVLRMQPEFPAAVLNRAGVYLALGDSATALATYETFKDVPEYQDVMRYNQAIITLSGDDQTAALQSAEGLVKDDPASAWRINLRGYVRSKSGDYQAALDDFDLAVDLAPGTPAPLLNRAETLTALHRFDEALAAYGALTGIEPKNPVYRLKQALAYEATGNKPSALDALSQAIVLDGRYVDAYLERARLEVQAEEFDKAQADADQVLALDPENGPAYAISGDCLLSQEEWVNAEEAYTTAEEQGVSTISLYEGRGWAHHRQEELRSAIADYRQAIALGANDTTLLLRLGFALIDMNQRKDALNALLGAVNGGLDTAEAHAALAVALDVNNQSADAEVEYRHALSLDAQFEDRDYVRGLPLWSSLSANRAMAIVKRLKK